MYELLHELKTTQDLLKSLKCLDLMVSTQLTTQKANFDICAKKTTEN